MATVGAGRGCGGLRPRPLPRHGGGLGPGYLLPGDGRLGRRGRGRPWLHSGGSSPVYLASLWVLFLEVRSWLGWALLSSKVWPSGLSGALLLWSLGFAPNCWGPVSRGGTGSCPYTRSSRLCGRCGKAVGRSRLF